MFQFGERHPVLFEIVLVIAAFLAAGVFSLVGAILNVHPALSSSVGRVLIGAALIVIYNRAFTRGRPFKNLPAVIPALLFAIAEKFNTPDMISPIPVSSILPNFLSSIFNSFWIIDIAFSKSSGMTVP